VNESCIRRQTTDIDVGNQSYDALEEDLRRAPESFGEGSSARIFRDGSDGKRRPFAKLIPVGPKYVHGI
jgi:hypothetical protein